MMILFCFILLVVVFAKRGVDVYSMSVGGFLFYYYPVLFFDDIYWLSGGVHYSHVSFGARYVAAMLLCGYSFWAYFLPNIDARHFKSMPERSIYGLARVSLLVAVASMVALFFININGGGSSKTDLMAGVSYEIKLLDVAASIFFVMASIINRRLYLFYSFCMVMFSLWLGFRFLAMELLVVYFFINPIHGVRKTFIGVLFAAFVVACVVLSKLFFYSLPSKELIDQIFESQLIGSSLSENLSMANSESSSVGVLFNEFISNDWSISLNYIYNVMLSLLPGGRIFGMGDVEGFAEIYKSFLPVDGIESFASSMYAIGFGLFGYFGVFIFFLGHIFLVRQVVDCVKLNLAVPLKILIIFSGTVLVCYAHRADIIFNLSLVKMGILIISIYVMYNSFIRSFGKGV